MIRGTIQQQMRHGHTGSPSGRFYDQNRPRGETFEIQKALDTLGFDAGNPDGVAGERTRQAIRSFQQSIGRAATGYLTDDELVMLNRRAANGRPSAPPLIKYASPYGPNQPSFDCSRAKRPVERLVCSSPDLAALDRQMAGLYADAISRAGQAHAAALKESQNDWVAFRNTCLNDVSCVRTFYRDRIEELNAQENPSTPFKVSIGYDLPGGDYQISIDDTTRRTSYADCERMCTADKRCVGFVYDMLLRACKFKNDISTPQSDGKMIAAIKNTSPTRIASSAQAPSARSATSFNRPGFRDLDPVMHGNRLLLGYPIVRGMFSTAKIKLHEGDYASHKALTEARLYMSLALLRQWPDSINREYVARTYGHDFLTGALYDKYFATCKGNACDNVGPYQSWAGTNEFERTATYKDFIANIPAALEAAAPRKLDFTLVKKAHLGAYNDRKEAFPIQYDDSNIEAFGNLALKFGLATPIELPQYVDVPRAQAPKFIEPLQARKRLVYVAIDLDLRYPKREKHVMTPHITDVSVYADETLRYKIKEIPLRKRRIGRYTTDGKPFSYNGKPLQTFKRMPIVGTGETAFIKNWRPFLGLVQLATLWHDRTLLDNKIFVQSLGNIVPDDAKRYISDNSVTSAIWAGNDEFQTAVAKNGFMKNVLPRLLREAPSFPLDVFVVQHVALGKYDMNRHGFPLISRPDDRYPLNGIITYKLPDFWSVDTQNAEEALQAWRKLNPNTYTSDNTSRRVYLGAVITLSGAHADYTGSAWHITGSVKTVKSFSLYVDENLTEHLADLPVPGQPLKAVTGKTPEAAVRKAVPIQAAKPPLKKAAAIETAERQAKTPSSTPKANDIVGIKLGMTFAQADEIIGHKMAVGTILTADRKRQNGAKATFKPYSSGRMYISKDGKEIITIYDEPPAKPGVVLAVARQVRILGSKVPRKNIAELIKSKLTNKYGSAPKWVERDDWSAKFWTACWSIPTPIREPEPNCGPARTSGDGEIWYTKDGKSANNTSPNGVNPGDPPAFARHNYAPRSAGSPESADSAGIVAEISTWPKIIKIDTWLFNDQVYSKAFFADKTAFETKEAASAAAAKAHIETGIKF